jgi:hypothetical protein
MAELGLVARVLSALHSVPLWILIAFAAVGYAGLLAPGFGGIDVSEFKKQWGPFFWLDAVAFTILSMAYTIDLWVKHATARVNRRHRWERAAYMKVYGPMYAELERIHVNIIVRGFGAPKLRDRIQNARFKFDAIKRHRYRIRTVAKALFDKKPLPAAGEVDRGGGFPIEKLERIVQSNRLYCDDALLDLIDQAVGKRREEHLSDDILSDEDVQLYDHILRQTERLQGRIRSHCPSARDSYGKYLTPEQLEKIAPKSDIPMPRRDPRD